ncbi:MAG: Hydrogenase small subunit [Thermodesulfobacteriota bacterium]|nr:Hydrogenase small subunit [Thermodesulfobacteriota bacterium]
MRIGRREFIKYCFGSAASLGLSLSALGKLEKALAAGGLPSVVWLNGANCTGCTVSLANRFSSQAPTDIADLLVNTIDLAFHPNLMGAAGDLAVDNLIQATAGEFILAVDGGIPTAFGGNACMVWTENGKEVTALSAVRTLAPKAKAVLSIGSCASFGGIPAGNPNPTGIMSVRDASGRSTINIPGCPTHPDWIVWTVAQLLSGATLSLDSFGRPATLFGSETVNVHKRCPRKDAGETKTFGVEGRCLKEIGCKGPRTQADCPVRKWNSGTNWCVGANAVCIGCTESGFPDKFSPFYTKNYTYSEYQKPEKDLTAPIVTAFSIPAGSGSLTVPIYTFAASDNVIVTGYLLTETATKPSATAAGWTAAKPVSYTFTSAGAKTLYAWAKDSAGNISASLSASVTITGSSGMADISTPSSLDLGRSKVNESVKKTLNVTNNGASILKVTKIEVVGTDAADFKAKTTRFNLDPLKKYSLQIEFKPTAKRTYTATLRIYSNDPDTPVKGITLRGQGVK